MKTVFAFFTAVCLMAVPAFGDINVSGEGSATVKPDLAHVQLAVVSDGKSPSEALEKNNVAMKRLFTAMEEFKVDAKDVQTTNLNLEPKYIYEKDKQTLVGYTVVNQVEICVRKLDTLGEVITGLVGDGANRLGGFKFGATNTQAAMDAARVKAMEDAKRKADLLVKTAGTTLGRVVSINEQSYRNISPGYAMRSAMAESAPGGTPTPTSGGELAFKVQVNVQWTIGQETDLAPFEPDVGNRLQQRRN